MKLYRVSAVAFGSLIWFQSHAVEVASATVTLNNGGVTQLEVVARDTHDGLLNQIETLFPTSLPFIGSHSAIDGNSRSQAEYQLTQEGFHIVSTGIRDGLLDSRANVQPQFFFAVDVNTPYSLTGHLLVDDPGNVAKGVELDVSLTDVDSSSVLFRNLQQSFGVVDEIFTIGETEGNLANQLSGSATGTLLAGHRYRLFYGTSIYASNSGDSATFFGNFSLSFVPEPSTGSLCLMGFMVAQSRRLRRRG